MLTHGTLHHRRRRVAVGLVIGLALGLLALASHEQGARVRFRAPTRGWPTPSAGRSGSSTRMAPARPDRRLDGRHRPRVLTRRDEDRVRRIRPDPGRERDGRRPHCNRAVAALLPAPHPAWSPDGSKIAVEGGPSGYASGLQVFRVSDGAVVGQYFPDPAQAQTYMYPSWRPTGTTTDIAVVRSQGRKGPDAAEIYIIHTPDGSTTNITNTPNVQEYGQLDWSPDGQKLAFHATCTSQDGCTPDVSNLSTIAATGGSEVNLATHVTGEGIAYSPDGTRIAYATGSSVIIASPTANANGITLPIAAKGLSWGGPSAPLVTGVSPRSGPIKGGNRITVTGSGFTGAYGVCLIPSGLNHGNPGGCTSAIHVVSDSQITLTAFDFSAFPQTVNNQTYDVRVQRTANAPTSRSPVTAADQYTAALTVTGLSARSGPIKGGNRITIAGSGFTGAYGVCFRPTGTLNLGNRGACVQLRASDVNSDTKITVPTPDFVTVGARPSPARRTTSPSCSTAPPESNPTGARPTSTPPSSR